MDAHAPRRALVVGCGSIGKRHLRNLKALGVAELLAVDPSPERLSEARALGAAPAPGLPDALARRPELAVIATPTSLHLAGALEAARAGCHLLIEKPLSHSLEGLDALEAEVRSRGLTALVGCNLRFHPAVESARRLLREGVLGKPWCASFWAGQYLPDWHPGEDYRQGYSARPELGGGVLLDGIHEIDVALDLLGPAAEVGCMTAMVGDLGIGTEDAAEVAVRLRCGALAAIHVDYLQRAYRRGFALSGSQGSLSYHWGEPALHVYRASSKAWERLPVEFPDPNAMYLSELEHLFACLGGAARPAQGLAEAREALELVLAAKESAATGKRVSLPRRPRVVAVIQARMGSTRLPGKVLKSLAGASALSRMIERVRLAREVDRIVVATALGDADDPVAAEAARCGVAVFRGSEEDVLDRVTRAARAHGATAVVRLTADCPAVDPGLIDRVAALLREGASSGAAYARLAPDWPDGLDVEAVSMEALEAAWREARLPSEREHVLPFVWKRPERFGALSVPCPRDLGRVRLTLDEEADLRLLELLFEGLYRPGRPFTWEEAVAWLEAHPQAASLNAGIERDEGYRKSLERDGNLK